MLSVAVIWESLSTTKEVAAVPLIVTEVAPVKLVPVITMETPELVQAVMGLKLDIDCEKLLIPDNNEIMINNKKDFEFTVLEYEFISK